MPTLAEDLKTEARTIVDEFEAIPNGRSQVVNWWTDLLGMRAGAFNIFHEGLNHATRFGNVIVAGGHSGELHPWQTVASAASIAAWGMARILATWHANPPPPLPSTDPRHPNTENEIERVMDQVILITGGTK
jgi:hypothetical protein